MFNLTQILNSNLFTTILFSRSKFKSHTFSLGLNLKKYKYITMQGNNNSSWLKSMHLVKHKAHDVDFCNSTCI